MLKFPSKASFYGLLSRKYTNINLVQFITQLFAEAIGVAEDKAFFTGSGSGQPKGITAETITSQAVAGASPSMDDVIDLIDLVPQRVTQSPKAAFVGHRKVKRALRKIKCKPHLGMTRYDSV